MKRIAALVIVLLPLIGMAQKEIKPNVSKAEKLLREGKLDEAKEMIDVTVGSTEFMTDKKGRPTKNAAKAYYIKGLIYVSIDTTKIEKYHTLSDKPFDIAAESFKKAEELDPKSGSFISDPKTFFPILTTQISGQLQNYYAQASLNAYNKKKDYKEAFLNIERALTFNPKDTSLLSLAGVYFGPAAEEYDKSLDYINRYLDLGGKDANASLQKISIYLDKKKDNDGALKAIHEAVAKFPNNEDFPKYELNIYLTDKDYAKARKFVGAAVKKNPNDPHSQFMLGQLYDRTNSPDSARIAYQKTIDLDPTNFEANMELARSFYVEGRKIKTMRDKLGISAADIAQRKVLLEKQRSEYKIALPYWEKCEKLKPEDPDVLYTLSDIYSSLVMDDQQARIDKKIKALGLDK